MIGALGSIQTKIVFAVDRASAEILEPELFSVNGKKIKHIVIDAQDRECSEEELEMFQKHLPRRVGILE
jgi:hypothetical protein